MKAPRARGQRSSAAGGAALLHGRTRDGAVAAKDATVAGLGLEPRAAMWTVEEEEARVGRHRVRARLTAGRTGDDAFQFQCFTVAGKPASLTAFASVSAD